MGASPNKTTMQRFCGRVRLPETPDGCWEWVGHRKSNGYVRFVDSDNGKDVAVHRYSYERFVGPIPEGLEIDHLCRNRACVNPAHLEAVTHRVNNQRGYSPTAINAAKTHCVRGHELAGDNIYPWDGIRHCRACGKVRYAAKKRTSHPEG